MIDIQHGALRAFKQHPLARPGSAWFNSPAVSHTSGRSRSAISR